MKLEMEVDEWFMFLAAFCIMVIIVCTSSCERNANTVNAMTEKGAQHGQTKKNE